MDVVVTTDDIDVCVRYPTTATIYTSSTSPEVRNLKHAIYYLYVYIFLYSAGS